MERFQALVSLNMSCDVGSRRLKELLEDFGSPERIMEAPRERLLAVPGIGQGIAEKIRSFKTADLEKELELARRENVRVMTIDDADYPECLRQIYDPPIVLYLKGNLLPEDKYAVAVVGSRRASFYGLSCAGSFSGQLAVLGYTVVSGMARGIDTAAHRGALKSGGRTIAVIGSGLSQVYPPENKRLAEEISSSGAVVSEFPMQAKPFPQNFPRRNRLISGLSMGVLVAEAAQNSGALITADFALQQGREVFVIPGKIDAPNSFGPHELIKQGAKLVSCVQDLTEEFISFPRRESPPLENIPVEQASPLAEGESALYKILSREPVLIDDIARQARLGIPEVSGILLSLEMKKLIRQLPGKQFMRSRPAKPRV